LRPRYLKIAGKCTGLARHGPKDFISRLRGRYFEKPGERTTTTRSANRSRGWILTSVRQISGIVFVAAALFGAHAKAAANPSAYLTNAGDNTVSVIATASNTVVATIPVGNRPQDVAITPASVSGVKNESSSPEVGIQSLETQTNRWRC
jgi:YVTN family beta-propeller protein